VTKRNKAGPTFLYHIKDRLSYFYDKQKDWWRRALVPEIMGQTDPANAKTMASGINFYSQLVISLIVCPISDITI